MTRINVVPVSELSDQWLIAEYRELPRCIKQDINTDNAPLSYCLGKGHLKWAKKHSGYLMNRYGELCEEMELRGFKVNNPFYKFIYLYELKTKDTDNHIYFVSKCDIYLNQQRLIEKYKLKPDFYKWTCRPKPTWLDINKI